MLCTCTLAGCMQTSDSGSAQNSEVTAGALTKAGIKFTPAVASVFCWVDLRSALSEPTWEAERQLWEEGFVQRCGFIITPGASAACATQEL